MRGHEILTEQQAYAIADMVKDALTRTGWSLSRLAKEAGVDQPMAFNVARARIKRRTPKVRRLESYVRIKIGVDRDEDFHLLHQAARAYVAVGGDVADIVSMIEVMTVAAHRR
jgi:ribosome-binding protein aMBF1 (putative translation factor)